ncbi:hypothetical protein Tco_1023219, partial [Tanacetum coccineum]
MLEELVKEPIVGTSSVCIKETTTCSLFSPKSILTGEKILCAHVSVYPVRDGLIHGKRLRKGYMRVSVLKVLNRQEGLELPVPDEDIPNLGGTLRFAKHPCNKCRRQERARKEPIQQSEVEKEKAAIRKRLHSLKEDIDLRSEAVKNGYYRWMAREDCIMSMTLFLIRADNSISSFSSASTMMVVQSLLIVSFAIANQM